MRLDELPSIVAKKKKRVGRGYGSGKGGHTAGRGQKGQKSRSKIGPLFEGTKIKKSLIQRLPLQRGKGKLKPSRKPVEISLGKLNRLSSDSVVDVDALIKAGIVEEEVRRRGVKILGTGKLEKKLKVKVATTSGAKDKIKKAGGEVQEQ